MPHLGDIPEEAEAEVCANGPPAQSRPHTKLGWIVRNSDLLRLPAQNACCSRLIDSRWGSCCSHWPVHNYDCSRLIDFVGNQMSSYLCFSANPSSHQIYPFHIVGPHSRNDGLLTAFADAQMLIDTKCTERVLTVPDFSTFQFSQKLRWPWLRCPFLRNSIICGVLQGVGYDCGYEMCK